MAKRMLVDATHSEETRVAIVDGQRLEDLDFEIANRKTLKGNIYLAQVIRVEPSLQAAFVEYGGNRHGFLAFSEIHPDYYSIPVGDRPPSAEDEAEDFADAPIITEGPGALAMDEDGDELPDDDEAEERDAEGRQDMPSESGDETGSDSSWRGGFALEANDSLIRDFSAPSGEGAVPFAADPVVEMVGGEAVEPVQERRVRPSHRRYKIQEVIKRRQVMLIQVVKEERGNKGAALTTFLSLAGRYCVLMPNTAHGGGVSRKITNFQERRRMKEILDQLEAPDGMAVILRTAGMEQEVVDIQRDLDYLLRLWNGIREQTLQSTAPALIHEEADLIKRAIRDLYGNDINELLVAGAEGFDRARDFMRMLVPDAVDNVRRYDDADVPLFFRFQVENQIDALHQPVVNLPSGGYVVINPTEALVSIDVNSGRATRERHIEETALKTNLEAATEIGRQLRLRDLAGLVVIDFIDMEDGRNNAAVERRLKEAMRHDRARLQIGRISHFGLLELSRQRLRPSLLETSFGKCPHCAGLGYVRATDSAALSVLRSLEEEGIKNRGGDYLVKLPSAIAVYILNHKRNELARMQARYRLNAQFLHDDAMPPSEFSIERLKTRNTRDRSDAPAVNAAEIMAYADDEDDSSSAFTPEVSEQSPPQPVRSARPPRRRNGGGGRFVRRPDDAASEALPEGRNENDTDQPRQAQGMADENDSDRRGRRRGRRGGRRRGRTPGSDRFNGSNGNGNDHGQGHADQAAAPRIPERTPPVNIPRSIHDIDTTPREDGPRAAMRQDNRENFLPSGSMGAGYDAMARNSGSDDKPKTGWWRRLTGQ